MSTHRSDSAALYPHIRTIRCLLPAILLVLSVGCAAVGGDFPTNPVDEFKTGKTTQADISSMSGSPGCVGIENGQKT